MLNIDAYNRALGNASCGSDVIDKYRIRAEKTFMHFLLMPLTETLTDAQMAERARIASPVCQPVRIQSTKGRVTLSCPTPGATIRYSIDGGEEQTYTKPFALTEGGLVRTYATAAGLTASLVNEERIGMFVDKSQWSVRSVSSEQGGNEAAKNVIDGNASTIWHTKYNPTTPCPHEIIIDMAKYYRVSHFVYQGREDMGNGRIKDYEFYVSDSPTAWGSPVAKGTLQNSSSEQQTELTTRPVGRYFRLIILSTHDNQGYASAAELGIIPEAEVEKPDPVSAAAYTTGSTALYYLRHKGSGLFLHFIESNGAFGLGQVGMKNLDDLSYVFHFNKLTGFTAFVTLNTRSPQRYVSISGWNVNGVEKQNTGDHAQWLMTEQVSSNSLYLRGAEMGGRYFNFDHTTAGSLVYSDKEKPAEFEIIPQSQIEAVVGISTLTVPTSQSHDVYDLAGRRTAVNYHGIVIVDGEKRLQ